MENRSAAAPALPAEPGQGYRVLRLNLGVVGRRGVKGEQGRVPWGLAQGVLSGRLLSRGKTWFSSRGSFPLTGKPCCGWVTPAVTTPLGCTFAATCPRGWKLRIFRLGKGGEELPWPPQPFLLRAAHNPCHSWLTDAHRLVPGAILPGMLCAAPPASSSPRNHPAPAAGSSSSLINTKSGLLGGNLS